MKKFFSLIMCLSITLSSVCAINADENIKIYVDGKQVETDQPPVIIDGRTLVPLRAAAEAMGCEVEWNAEEKEITLTKGPKRIFLNIGSSEYFANEKYGGGVGEMDTAPAIINGKTMLPIRYVAENYYYDVEWNAEERCIYINNPANSLGDNKYYVEENDEDELVGSWYLDYEVKPFSDEDTLWTQRIEVYISKNNDDTYKVITKEITVDSSDGWNIGANSVNECKGYLDKENNTFTTEFVQNLYDDYGFEYNPDVYTFEDGELIHTGIEEIDGYGILERF